MFTRQLSSNPPRNCTEINEKWAACCVTEEKCKEDLKIVRKMMNQVKQADCQMVGMKELGVEEYFKSMTASP